MSNIEYDDFYEGPEDYYEPEFEYTPDSYYTEAQEDLRKLYENDRESVYYVRQLQVKYEKKYYHWITYNALKGLKNVGYLRTERIPKETGTSTVFYVHSSNRYARRKIRRVEQLIEEYSKDNITRSCGHRAEDLFVKALSLRGFMPSAQKVREFNGREWTETGHDLDFVFQRDGINYGCEIKNTLGYIDIEELESKLRMCEYFGVKPLFIMRYSPKTYNKMIIDKGGFALIYETQIYDLSQEGLVNRIRTEVGLPVICPRAIPSGIIDRFERWHMRNI